MLCCFNPTLGRHSRVLIFGIIAGLLLGFIWLQVQSVRRMAFGGTCVPTAPRSSGSLATWCATSAFTPTRSPSSVHSVSGPLLWRAPWPLTSKHTRASRRSSASTAWRAFPPRGASKYTSGCTQVPRGFSGVTGSPWSAESRWALRGLGFRSLISTYDYPLEAQLGVHTGEESPWDVDSQGAEGFMREALSRTTWGWTYGAEPREGCLWATAAGCRGGGPFCGGDASGAFVLGPWAARESLTPTLPFGCFVISIKAWKYSCLGSNFVYNSFIEI